MIRRLLPALLLAAGTMLASMATQAGDLPEERTLYVAPGQSLPSLVRTLYPDHPAYWDRITDWIVDENAHAFVDADPARMRAEVRVRIPGRAQLERVAAEAPASGAASAQAGPAADDGEADARESALVFGERFLFVNPAQSLAELVPRIYADHEDLWGRIVEAIMERNRERLASVDQDATVARGTRLQIPEVVPAEPEPAEPEAAEAPAPLTEPSIGVFVQVRGDVEVESRYSRVRAARTDHPVHRGDLVHTAAAARVVIELDDGERLYVRPDSRVRMRDWELPESGPGARVVELLEGGLRAVTGAIGNRSDDAYRTVTPNATMGVRGTDYSLRLCASGECAAADNGHEVAAGLYAGVHSGGVHLLNVAGELHLEAGEFGHVVDEDRAPVRVDAADMDFLFAAAADDEPAMPQVEAPDEEPEDADDSSSWGWLWAVGALILLGVAL